MATPIAPATPGEVPAAVRRLFAPAAADRVLAMLAAGELSAEHLLVARRGGRVVGAAFAEPAGHGLAGVRPPAADAPAVADELARALVARLAAAGVAVAQCLLPPDAEPAAGPLLRAGFRPVTRLLTLYRPPGPVPPPAALELVPDALDPAGFARTFAATLVGSLDLPELTGLRPPAAELAGYATAHRRLVRQRGEVGGVLTLAPGEVQYLGLVPAARGRGLGHALLGHALAELQGDTREVALSVDARNAPARRLYARHGFGPLAQVLVLLWTAPR